MNLVCIKVYNSRIEAEVAKGLLDANGIKSLITSDDSGGMRPHMSLTEGVKLMINSDDRDKAQKLLFEV